jgi:DNA gyrase subunit A
MVKQLDLLNQGQIIPTALHTEMERSYLEYAMSVIVGRALPDVRDGLKPVHRRILYAMYELGLTPDRPFRKCARVVGDVLGKYHPHGDQAVYDAMVRLIQDFSSRYPLLAGHGNFGSIDNDPAAAMRYTETRIAPIGAEAVLKDINEATVDFTSNFDNSQQEPVILPAQLPILLLNGCSGIAVGMATNIPPHNLGEVVDGLIALIDNPELTDEQLWEYIPAPDFPTGGEILDTQGIKEAYLTGKGIIPLRGVATIEQLRHNKKHSREKTAIIVTELPFQVNKAGWIEKIAELVNQGKLCDIADIRDESDRQGIRVVIELKRDTDGEKVLEQLYKHTALQTNFGVIMLALVNNKPCQLSLKELLQEFLKFRETTLTRQYSFELEGSQQKLHHLEGLLAALNNLDSVIEILRNSPDGTTAKIDLQQQLNISNSQADSILAMPLRRLTGLERQKLETERQELQVRIKTLEKLLGERNELLKALKRELRALKRKFADPRRTKIISPPSPKPQENKQSAPKLEEDNTSKTTNNQPSENALIQITKEGKISWYEPEETSNLTSSNNHTDLVIKNELIAQQNELIVFLDSGKAYPITVSDIPHYPKQKTVEKLLSKGATQDGNLPLDYFVLNEQKLNANFILLTQQGKLKKIVAKELENVGNRGLMLIKLKEGDRLYSVHFSREGEEMAIATNGGRILRFDVTDEQIPLLGRSAQGNQGIKLRYQEKIVGATCLKTTENLVLISELGYGKIMSLKEIRKAQITDLGTQAFRFTNKEDHLIAMFNQTLSKNVIAITNQARKLTLNIDKLPIINKDQYGENIIKLKINERITEVIIVSN